jgi:hypothetical protein
MEQVLTALRELVPTLEKSSAMNMAPSSTENRCFTVRYPCNLSSIGSTPISLSIYLPLSSRTSSLGPDLRCKDGDIQYKELTNTNWPKSSLVKRKQGGIFEFEKQNEYCVLRGTNYSGNDRLVFISKKPQHGKE